ncbi:MAG: DUF5706 domain-containing protein [Bacteroidota bacterium]|nr:DUF5706 domain-containing protein [Bacteroidota bacterium]
MEEINQNINPTIKKYAKGGGKETLYRVTIRSQIRLISIMDSKANLVISMNTMLITGILAMLTGSIFWQSTREMKFMDHIPFVVLLFFSLGAMAYAIFATRTDLNTRKFNIKNSPIQYTLKHHEKASLSDYLAYMGEILLSNELIYENLNLDMYFLSEIVSRKSRLLNISYSLFLAGLIISVGLFMIFTLYPEF